MPFRRAERSWCVGKTNGLSAAHIAPMLARLSLGGELLYRGVQLEAVAVDHHDVSARSDWFYRLFLLRVISWPALGLPEHHRLPVQWRSEVISVPSLGHRDKMARLSDFEEEFAVRDFLHRVEREIDGVVLRAEDRNQSWPRGLARSGDIRTNGTY